MSVNSKPEFKFEVQQLFAPEEYLIWDFHAKALSGLVVEFVHNSMDLRIQLVSATGGLIPENS